MGLFDKIFHNTRSTVLHISSKSGLHLRPAAAFVAEAKRFQSKITAESRGRSVDAKILNELLSLSLEEGDHFELTCEGKDADEAISHLVVFFDTLMHQEEEKAEEKELGDLTAPHAIRRYHSDHIPITPLGFGIAIAPVHILKVQEVQKDMGAPFLEAISNAKAALLQEHNQAKGHVTAEIFLAQHALLESLEAVIRKDPMPTLQKFTALIQKEMGNFKQGALSSKKSDYLDLLVRIRSAMGSKRNLQLPSFPFILFAEKLLPSDIKQLDKSGCKGVILTDISPTSHTAILLQNSPLPSAIVEDKTELIEASISKRAIILDCTIAHLVPDPTKDDIVLAKAAQEALLEEGNMINEKRLEPAMTQSGKKIHVLANVSSYEDALAAKEAGAEGIGLLRTEFLFTTKRPTIQEQERLYHNIFSLFDDVTVRTLDVGGDKALPYLDIPREDNPFLGIRGVRLFNTHPEIMEEQLLALFRAAGKKSLKIMFPMVSRVEEFEYAKTFAKNVAKRHKLSIDHHQFGIMVEVPSVLFLLESFNRVVDFYSIGTNDLAQYLFAIERTHPTLKVPSDASLIIALIEHIIKVSVHPVSLCGELAGDTKALSRLLETGLDTLSLASTRIPSIKEHIRMGYY